MEENNFFVYKNDIDGNVAIGQISPEFDDVLSEIKFEWLQDLTKEQLTGTTCHIWYSDLSQSLKTKIDNIRNMKLWESLCDKNKDFCKKKKKLMFIPEMDEIYYFNLGSKFSSGRLYGANGNVEPHVDSGRLFQFKNIKLYRVLIGLSDDNKNTTTKFINAKLEKKINKNDYVVFDFDRTFHQVVKENKLNTPRFVLKLHFVICDDENEPLWKIELFKKCHIVYEIITRYFMEHGTDPTTWSGFFFGLILETDPVIYIVLCSIVLYFLIQVYKITNPIKITKYLVLTICTIYFIYVTCFWLYYVLTGER